MFKFFCLFFLSLITGWVQANPLTSAAGYRSLSKSETAVSTADYLYRKHLLEQYLIKTEAESFEFSKNELERSFLNDVPSDLRNLSQEDTPKLQEGVQREIARYERLINGEDERDTNRQKYERIQEELERSDITPQELAQLIPTIEGWFTVWQMDEGEILDYITKMGTEHAKRDFSGHVEKLLYQYGGKPPCFEGNKFFCRKVFSYSNEMEGFGGADLGLNGDSSSIRLKAWQMDLGLSENWRVPFSIYVADISSTADIEEANAQKLLDLEQGKLNFMFSGVGKFRIGEFCKYPFGIWGCYAGLQGGARYTQFESSPDGAATTTEKEDVIGAYLKAGINILLPVFNRGASATAGTLAISTGYAYYYQNLNDSTVLFPSITDEDGNPVSFEKDYQAFHFSMEMNITNRISARIKHYNPVDNDDLEETTLFEVGFTATVPE